MKIKINGEINNLSRTSTIWSIIKNISLNIPQEEPFYVCDMNDIIEQHGIWISNLPRVVPHYAVKCNDDITILEILAALGASFDCASKAEINKVLSIGVSVDRIVFANPAKPSSHIRYASSMGVDAMTFDNESELYKIQNIFPTARLIIRIRIDAAEAQCPLGMKFGCNPFTEAPRLLRAARSMKLNVVGVSFHVGSGCREPAVFKRAIAASREIFDYAQTLGFHFNLLDIGGGYPGGRGSSIAEIAGVVNEALNQYFPDPNVRVIAEPGRFYVTSAYTLTCNIHSMRKVLNDEEQETHRMYYINDGVYGSFNCILYDHQVVRPIPLKDYGDSKSIISSSIWGPTCDGLDQVIEDMPLPAMNIGDWIVFEDMGAYTLPVASPFNGFPVPEVFYVITHDQWSLLKGRVTAPENLKILNGPIKMRNDEQLYKYRRLSANFVDITPSVEAPRAFNGINSSDLMVG